MKERPILFSAPMVRALLDGSKTQTRRVAKLTDAGHVKEPGGHRRWHTADFDARLACPYGQPGDRLWVREAWGMFKKTPDDHIHACVRGDGRTTGFEPHYRATDTWEMPNGAWRPSIHMPRWASRITLEITNVRVERLQGITERDCIAEGIERYPDGLGWKRGKLSDDQNKVDRTAFPKLAYQSIWEEINGPESWAANPLVWVVEFKRVEGAKP